jgi:hypothetical protein
MLTPTVLTALDTVYAKAIRALDVTYTEPLERAYKLCSQERIVPSPEQPDRWQVTGSRNLIYVVGSTPDGWACTCPDHVYRHHPCYHVLACQLYVRARQAMPVEASRMPQDERSTLEAREDASGESDPAWDTLARSIGGISTSEGSGNDVGATQGQNGCADTSEASRANLRHCEGKNSGSHIPALGEAPASVNCHLMLEGRQIQLTMRGHDEQRLLERLATVLRQYPVASGAPPVPTSAPPQCPQHHRPMKASAKAEGTWYCTRRDEEGYCRERWPATGR